MLMKEKTAYQRRSSRKKLIYFSVGLFLLLALSAGAAVQQQDGRFVVLSWNDLGMHCSNKDFSTLAVLPPYNTLVAQVVKRGTGGEGPSLVREGIDISYEIPGNTYSVGKTNFWDYVKPLFGRQLPSDTGLNGLGLTGKFKLGLSKDYFEAKGIPVTPYTDFDPSNEAPYQLAEVMVKDGGGNLLAQTQAVIPVSNELNCSACHESEVSILNNHPAVSGFDPSGPVLCAECHASNALGTKGIDEAGSLSERIHQKHNDKTNDCYMCHPGPKTKCLRDVMSTRFEIVCQDCHGNLANVAESIAQGRRPWFDEPRCGTCHEAKYAEEPGKLFRNSRGHGGLFCSACHGSPHAIVPSREARDNAQNTALQGFEGTLRDCTVCHEAVPDGEGPHGMRMSGANGNAGLSLRDLGRVFTGIFSMGTAHAAGNACSGCHSDGRSGTPPATPAHVSAGLVSKGGAPTVRSAAPAARAPGRANPAASVPQSPASGTAGKSGGNLGFKNRAGSGNAMVCAPCHKDGRSGLTPPGHKAVAGRFGSGSAPGGNGQGNMNAAGPGSLGDTGFKKSMKGGGGGLSLGENDEREGRGKRFRSEGRGRGEYRGRRHDD